MKNQILLGSIIISVTIASSMLMLILSIVPDYQNIFSPIGGMFGLLIGLCILTFRLIK